MPFLEVYVLLPAFSRCSVSNDLHVDFFFLMCLWEKVSAMSYSATVLILLAI